MGLADVTSGEAVLRAMREYDELGRDAFLKKYGFKRATKFLILHNGHSYDSKAILAAAHGYQYPDEGPLPNNFNGGRPTTSKLEAIGFTIGIVDEAVNALSSSGVAFTGADCKLFGKYATSVHWNSDNVPEEDQTLFKSIRDRLKLLVNRIASASRDKVQLRPFTSLYQANGRSQNILWSCIYPNNVSNKSYALQVALIISNRGAEICLCLGAGRSQLQGLSLLEAQEELQSMQSRLATVPPGVVNALDRALPTDVAYRRSWLQDAGPSEFETLKDWLAYAASKEGKRASISLYIDPDELERIGAGVGQRFLEMADAAAPLFEYCYIGEESVSQLDLASRASFDLDSLEASAVAAGLELPFTVYRAIVAAILSDKHIILTGPPGTAKTSLAELVCRLANSAGYCSGYALTTATADWTTYETIGGLRPSRSGQNLEFHYGLFLEAIRADRWLVVDELNRSNFDRAFGQLFTVLSGQSVVLPYNDAASGKRIALVLEGVRAYAESSGSGYQASSYEVLKVPKSWRIVATMNVFDKSLLFEMSFALMRRFAFIEVPSPSLPTFAHLWGRHLEGLPEGQAREVNSVLTGLLQLRSVKDVGPAVFIDMAKFARSYVGDDTAISSKDLAFQLFYSYLLPQFEGVTDPQGLGLYKIVRQLTGNQQGKLRRTFTEVLGITLPITTIPGLEDADDDLAENDELEE